MRAFRCNEQMHAEAEGTWAEGCGADGGGGMGETESKTDRGDQGGP